MLRAACSIRDFAGEVSALMDRTNTGPAGVRYPMPRHVAREYVLAAHAGHCGPECHRSGYVCPDCRAIRRKCGMSPDRTSRTGSVAKYSPAGGRGLWRNRYSPCFATGRLKGRRGFDRFRRSGLRRNVLVPFVLRWRPEANRTVIARDPLVSGAAAPPATATEVQPHPCRICGTRHLSPVDCPDYLPF